MHGGSVQGPSWLRNLTADPFNKFVGYILGERVYGIQIPFMSGDSQQRVRPDWAIVLIYEHKLRKEALKHVVNDGHSLADALGLVIKDADLKGACFATPIALRSALLPGNPSAGHPPERDFQRARKVSSVRSSWAWRTPDNRELIVFQLQLWCGGDCNGQCGRVHQCRVKGCYGDHPACKRKEVASVGNGPNRALEVLYLFAGKQRRSDIGSFLKKFELQGAFKLCLLEFDFERSPQHDLNKDDLWEDVFTKLRSGGWFLIVPPPCNTFSRARFQWRKHPGPRPSKNRPWPKGFPWLLSKNSAIVDEANCFILQCISAGRICAQAGGSFFFLSIPATWVSLKMSALARFGSGLKSMI